MDITPAGLLVLQKQCSSLFSRYGTAVTKSIKSRHAVQPGNNSISYACVIVKFQRTVCKDKCVNSNPIPLTVGL